MPDNRDEREDQAGDGPHRAMPGGNTFGRPRSEDPLAELARLIDEDPFADFDRARAARQQAEDERWAQPETDHAQEPPAPEAPAEPGPGFEPDAPVWADAPDHGAPDYSLAEQPDPMAVQPPHDDLHQEEAGLADEPHQPDALAASHEFYRPQDDAPFDEPPAGGIFDSGPQIADEPAPQGNQPSLDDPLQGQLWNDPHDDVPEAYATSFDRSSEQERLFADIAAAHRNAEESEPEDAPRIVRAHEPVPVQRPDYDPVAALEEHLLSPAKEEPLAWPSNTREFDRPTGEFDRPAERDGWPEAPAIGVAAAGAGLAASARPTASAGFPAGAGLHAEDRMAADHAASDQFDSPMETPQHSYSETDPIYGEDGHLMPAHMDADGKEPRSRRGMVVLGSLVGLVVLGGAVALGYRGLGTEPGGEPPLIRADAEPAKIMAEGEDDPQTGGQSKLVYDRIGGADTAGEERLVSREEPVFDVEGRDREIRVINPGTATTLRGGTDDVQGEATAASDEPRRVRTVVVRPDGTIVGPSDAAAESLTGSGTPSALQIPSAPGNAAAAAQERAAQTTETLTAAAPPTQAEPGSTTGGQAAQPAQSPQAQPQTSAPSSSGQPLRITPDAPSNAQQAQDAPVEVAQAPSVPAPTSSAQTFPSGSFVVQVSSTRSEDEARGTASTIAQRHSGILSGYQTGVERADLGDRGIFYRVGVGPVNSQSDANALCERLKANGQDCFVRRN